MFKNLRKKKKGFTLIELIIVIAIIAILAAVALPKFGDVTKNAKVKTDQANAKTIANAATTLIAEDKIKLTEATKELTLRSDNDDDVKAIEGYLQNIPTPKSETGNFFVTIDKNGAVKVFLGKKEGTQFFPAP